MPVSTFLLCFRFSSMSLHCASHLQLAALEAVRWQLMSVGFLFSLWSFHGLTFPLKRLPVILSLGALARAGGSYSGDGKALTVRGRGGVVLDVGTLCANNLTLVGVSLFQSCHAVAPVSLSEHTAFVARDRHYSADQRARFDRAEALHQGPGIHASDDVLCEALSNGYFRQYNITPADIRENSNLRGSCPQCVQAKMRDKDMHESDHPPASHVGETLWMDLQVLVQKSVGGNSYALRVANVFSGALFYWPSVLKTGRSLFDTLVHNINLVFAAHGHRVEHIVGDSDPSFLPLVAVLVGAGINLTFC